MYISNDKKDIDPFDKKMMSIFQREKPYIMKGPLYLEKELQRTRCSLFLNSSSDDQSMSLFRPKIDAYTKNYSICELPEVPSANP